MALASIGFVSFQLDVFRSFNLSYSITWYEVNMLPSLSLIFRLLKFMAHSAVWGHFPFEDKTQIQKS